MRLLKTDKRKLLVAGSRSFERCPQEALDHIFQNMSYVFNSRFHVVIHGGARGVDQAAGRWAEARGYPVAVYEADWNKHGKRAGFIRNWAMVQEAHAAAVLWDGESRGTSHTIDMLRKEGIPHVVTVADPIGVM